MFIQVMRGAIVARDYIEAMAQIRFNNKYNKEAAETFEYFFNEVATEWNTANPDNQVEL